jgi:hypothetical protein
MGVTLYRLGICADESQGEGEDHDEWFGSLGAARRRRAELIRVSPRLAGHRYGEDFEIERVVFRDLPRRALLLAALNWRGCVELQEEVVPRYVPRRWHAGEED